MKTRVTNFGHLCLSFAFMLTLASCNKEDYYEKEYLDNPFQENPTTGTVEGGAQGGVDGSTQGGVDGGVEGSTTGSATGGSTTGVDGSTSGGAVGGVDGSTTSSTSGGAVGGVDGSTGGSTTGVDGSTSGGSTTGSTVGGVEGSTSGGTTGTPPVVTEEVFNQASAEAKKLDIVWIIDNSGSMADEQTALGTHFNSFIQEFITKDVDFKMAITTTDTSTEAKKGRMVTGSDVKLTSSKAQANPTQFMADFRNLVRVGISGSGNEKGLAASEGFMQKYAASFLRPDAYLAVVVLSDEEDQSANTPAFYADFLKSFKNNAGLVKVYSIVDKNLSQTPANGISVGFERYAEVSALTSGVVSDIRDDFSTVLGEMGDTIINLLDSFALSNDPIVDTLKVYVNGVLDSNYTFDASSRSIKFTQGNVPAVGSQIKVTYVKQ